MTQQVAWHVVLKVRPGCLDKFTALTDEMVASARGEKGTLAFERYIQTQADRVHVYERYETSADAAAHLATFLSEFAERFSAMVDREQFTVLGNPNQGLRDTLSAFGATFASPFGGFHR